MTKPIDLTDEELEAAIVAGEEAKAVKEERERPAKEEVERVAEEEFLAWKREMLNESADRLRAKNKNVLVSVIKPEDSGSGNGALLSIDRLSESEYEFSVFGNDYVSSYFEHKAGFRGSADDMRARFTEMLESIE